MVAAASRVCHINAMKTRRRYVHDRQRRRTPRSAPTKPAAPRPPTLVAQVNGGGSHWQARVMHRDLAGLNMEVIFPNNIKEQEGYYEVRPVGGRADKVEVIRPLPASGVASYAAILNHALRVEWPERVEREAEKLQAYRWRPGDGREDWRRLPIVTIDGSDARDFDDAVWAEGWENGGWHVLVAIADVAFYIKENSELGKEALERGNSTYFPDRVLPMLPEKLSNDLCSLRPNEDRPVVGVEMWVDGEGKLKKHKFNRGVIHSAARLTYDGVQAFFDGEKGGIAPAVAENLRHLLGVFRQLSGMKRQRGAMDLDLPEVQLKLKADGSVESVGMRARHDAHRLIEELMILANVAAAETLSKNGGGGLYRIHAEPTPEKLITLKATLGPLGFTVPAPNGGPKAWAKLVTQVQEHPAAQTLLRAILQSQQQAKYDPANIGHYGLALPLYSHFTSPIRRYSDLVVHRALLKALRDKDGLAWPVAKLARVAESINASERKSQQAEWEARDRLVAQHFAGLVGKRFTAVVVGIQPFGCFVAVEGVAEGLLPKWKLDGWAYMGGMNCWRRVRGGKGNLRIGSTLDVVLLEADALGGRLTFGLPQDEMTARADNHIRSLPRPARRGGRRRRPS